MNISPGSPIKIIRGAWEGRDAVVVEVRDDKVLVEIKVFGRATQVEVAPGDVVPSSARNEAWVDLEKRVTSFAANFGQRRWLEHCEQVPEPTTEELLSFWEELQSEWSEIKREFTTPLMEEFEAAFPVDMSDEEFLKLWDQQKSKWLDPLAFEPLDDDQARLADDRRRAAYRAEDAVNERRERDQFQRDLEEFKRAHLPDEATRAKLREQGRRLAAECEGPVRERIERTVGLILPDNFFTFYAWRAGLSDVEVQAFYEVLGHGESEIFRLCKEYQTIDQVKPGIDDRLVYRYYLDPPEFLTVLNGSGDGLHYGLWFDDPAYPADRVCNRYRDADIGTCGRTLLETLRGHIERRWGWFSSMNAKEKSDCPPEYPFWYAIFRESIMEFETGDVPEVGGDYKPYQFTDERIATIDVIGASVPGAYYERDTKPIYEALRSDEPNLEAEVEAALAQCAAGRPAEALALGRDFHCMSLRTSDAKEATANQLLVAAYTALGRNALAEIAAVHHKHRRIDEVDTYVR